MNKCLLSPDRESMADQRTDTIKVQFGESMSFIGVKYKKMSERLRTRVAITHSSMMAARES